MVSSCGNLILLSNNFSRLSINNDVILFDGVCNLCSSTVQFVIRHDKKNRYKFASLQSGYGQRLMQQFNLPVDELNSFILFENGSIYAKSTGALKVARHLNGAWPLLYGFLIIPKFIRDAVYSYVARHRYKWFGRKDACWVPTPALKEKFIDTVNA